MTEQDITSQVAKALRLKLGMHQREFWGGIGATQSAGSFYELGKRKVVPKPLRILIFERYICGIVLDVSTEEGVKDALRAGRLISTSLDAHQAARDALAASQRAEEAVNKARQARQAADS